MPLLAIAVVFYGLMMSCSGIACYYLLRRTVLNAPLLPDAAVDERYRELARVATRQSYFTVVSRCLLVPAYSLVAGFTRWPLLNDPVIQVSCGYGLFLLALTLPTAIMAWSEPDLASDP